jgi:hypothetical protein
MKGYVYLLLEVNIEGKERYKIGISKNHPDKRVKQLQTGSSNKISTLNYFESANYKKIERLIHLRFHNKKTDGGTEWFALDDEDITSFISICKEYDNMVSFMKENNSFYK